MRKAVSDPHKQSIKACDYLKAIWDVYPRRLPLDPNDFPLFSALAASGYVDKKKTLSSSGKVKTTVFLTKMGVRHICGFYRSDVDRQVACETENLKTISLAGENCLKPTAIKVKIVPGFDILSKLNAKQNFITKAIKTLHIERENWILARILKTNAKS